MHITVKLYSTEYLQRDEYNIFYIDWQNLSSNCYPVAVHDIQLVGACTAQLVDRIRDGGCEDIHVIGFSLGAQVTNYIANSLKPDYLLPRITGLVGWKSLFQSSDNQSLFRILLFHFSWEMINTISSIQRMHSLLTFITATYADDFDYICSRTNKQIMSSRD